MHLNKLDLGLVRKDTWNTAASWNLINILLSLCTIWAISLIFSYFTTWVGCQENTTNQQRGIKQLANTVLKKFVLFTAIKLKLYLNFHWNNYCVLLIQSQTNFIDRLGFIVILPRDKLNSLKGRVKYHILFNTNLLIPHNTTKNAIRHKYAKITSDSSMSINACFHVITPFFFQFVKIINKYI